MVLVGVGKDYATNVRDQKPGPSQTLAQSRRSFFGLGPGVDDCDRILGDQVDVDGADVERSGKGDGDDLHEGIGAGSDFTQFIAPSF